MDNPFAAKRPHANARRRSALRARFAAEAAVAQVHVLSIRILGVLQSGATAALEVRYCPRGGYTTFVPGRHGGGWQAVAIVPGGSLPAI
jgi:ABC-type uncharacterized transport system permease subunit